MIDKKALAILFSKYWAPSKGWVKNTVSPEDFQYAKAAGAMFDDIEIQHNELLQSCITQCNLITKTDVVAAFISSLSSRRLDLRSALSSYACGQNLPLHDFQGKSNTSCTICGTYQKDSLVELNVLNFERHKFGGVRHIQPVYIWLDLTIFLGEQISQPSIAERDTLRKIIDELRNLNSGKLSDAEKCIAPFFKANKNEREGIISALGYLGVLHIPTYQPFYKTYTPEIDRCHSSYAKSDWPFPSDLWLPEFGLNDESIQYWFGEYI